MDFASVLAYAVVLATHLACIAFFGGVILLTDLRLPGWTLKSFSISDVTGKMVLRVLVGVPGLVFQPGSRPPGLCARLRQGSRSCADVATDLNRQNEASG